MTYAVRFVATGSAGCTAALHSNRGLLDDFLRCLLLPCHPLLLFEGNRALWTLANRHGDGVHAVVALSRGRNHPQSDAKITSERKDCTHSLMVFRLLIDEGKKSHYCFVSSGKQVYRV